MSNLTKAQDEALEKAWGILTEHFDRVLLIADSDQDAPNGHQSDNSAVYWHGGYMSAMGMAHYALERITSKNDETPH